jgi:hypothetical protein
LCLTGWGVQRASANHWWGERQVKECFGRHPFRKRLHVRCHKIGSTTQFAIWATWVLTLWRNTFLCSSLRNGWLCCIARGAFRRGFTLCSDLAERAPSSVGVLDRAFLAPCCIGVSLWWDPCSRDCGSGSAHRLTYLGWVENSSSAGTARRREETRLSCGAVHQWRQPVDAKWDEAEDSAGVFCIVRGSRA